MSADEEADAVKALLATVTKGPAYDHDEAQKLGTKLPSEYTVIYLSKRSGGNLRGDTRNTDLRRLQTRVHATKVVNARLIEDRMAASFEHSTATIAGSLVHFELEAQDAAFELDAGYYHRLTDWTFSV